MADEEAFYESFSDLDSNHEFFGLTDTDLEADREHAIARASTSAQVNTCESKDGHATRSNFGYPVNVLIFLSSFLGMLLNVNGCIGLNFQFSIHPQKIMAV